jgi:hypothetical protein
MSEQHVNAEIYTGTGQPGRGFVRSRLHNFGLTMVVMGASFSSTTWDFSEPWMGR